MRRVKALATVMAVLVAACGGGGDGGADAGDAESPTTTQATVTETTSGGDAPPTTAVAAEAPSEPAGEDEGSGPSFATVTLGGDTYSFSSEGAIVAQCLTDLFGIFSVQLPMVDESGAVIDGGVQIVALREGTDPDVVGEVNSVNVSAGDDDWVADEADMMYEQSDILEPGMGQVDSVEIDGRTVRGTATFFRQLSLFTDEVETITGSFEATCGEERTS